MQKTISVQFGRLGANDESAERRKKLREMLISGKEVKVTGEGAVKSPNEITQEDGNAISVPSGKLAASFYWYEKDKALYQNEVAAMKHFFPKFKLEALSDGRLSWIGKISPNNVREGAEWLLQLVYDHNHPHNNTFGGSIRVYSVDPDLEELQEKLGESIPHLLRDSSGNICLCTARKEDVKVGKLTTSAASSLSWAAKWITVFELWLAGNVSTEEFSEHTF